MKSKNKNLTREQFNHLVTRLRDARYAKKDSSPKRAQPASVARARELFRKWDAMCSRAMMQHERRVDKAHSKAYETLLFSDPATALAAVQAFEKLKV